MILFDTYESGGCQAYHTEEHDEVADIMEESYKLLVITKNTMECLVWVSKFH